MEINVTTEESFNEAMTTASGPVVVLFTAPTWCQPCRQFEPHWNKAQEAASVEDYTFIKVDMGSSPEDTGSHWASKTFRIMGVPQVKVHRGEAVGLEDGTRFRGIAEWEDIKARAVIPFLKELDNG